MALPVHLGGLAIANPSRRTTTQYKVSKEITAPLVTLIKQQSHANSNSVEAEQIEAKNNVHTLHSEQDRFLQYISTIS